MARNQHANQRVKQRGSSMGPIDNPRLTGNSVAMRSPTVQLQDRIPGWHRRAEEASQLFPTNQGTAFARNMVPAHSNGSIVAPQSPHRFLFMSISAHTQTQMV